LCNAQDAPLTAGRLIALVRRLAAQRTDGLLRRSDLVRALGADEPGVDTILHQLQNAGLVLLTPQSGPVQVIAITNAGRADPDRTLGDDLPEMPASLRVHHQGPEQHASGASGGETISST
jgi:hypothetical protein